MNEIYHVPGCRVERVHGEADTTTLVARAAGADARCPACATPSSAVHSTYVRRPADLPALGRAVRLAVRVRRFYCRVPTCRRRTFAERVPGLLAVRAHRTRRLAAAQRAPAVETGAEAGVRVARQLAMPASPDTLLRLLRRAPLPKVAAPRALGVDDWALKRGRTYGTILVDLEARRVVDLLPDRSGSTLAKWLRQRPNVAVVARDRSTEYTRAITAALPGAVQVADRWHLLLNVRQMLERWLATVSGRLRKLPAAAATGPARTAASPRSPTEVRAGAAAREHWRAVYDEVRRRHAAREPLTRIARSRAAPPGVSPRRRRSPSAAPGRSRRAASTRSWPTSVPGTPRGARTGCNSGGSCRRWATRGIRARSTAGCRRTAACPRRRSRRPHGGPPPRNSRRGRTRRPACRPPPPRVARQPSV